MSTGVDTFLDATAKQSANEKTALKLVRDELIQRKVPNAILLHPWKALDYHRCTCGHTFQLWYQSIFIDRPPILSVKIVGSRRHLHESYWWRYNRRT